MTKQTLKLNKYDCLEIIWLDSHTRNGWNNPLEVQKWIDEAVNTMTIKTVGYFFHEDKDFIRVCQSHDEQHRKINGEGDDNKDALFAIAKSCIKEIKVIKKQNSSFERK